MLTFKLLLLILHIYNAGDHGRLVFIDITINSVYIRAMTVEMGRIWVGSSNEFNARRVLRI